MNSLKTLILSCVAVGLFLLLTFGGHTIVASLKGLFISKDRVTELTSRTQALERENQNLRFSLQIIGEKTIPLSRFHYKRAGIFSSYPFNDRSFLLLDAGSADGIAPNMPVFIEGGVLLGEVKRVTRTQSEVETIFSPTWKSSVSIGGGEVKALLTGDNTPQLGLIPKSASLKDGDTVLNLSPSFPFHVALGTITNLQGGDHALWQQASLEVPYTLEDATSVLVLVDFP